MRLRCFTVPNQDGVTEMLSNYPPGVTGNEPEINGPEWEGTVERACEQEADLNIVGQEVASLINAYVTSQYDEFVEKRLLRAIKYKNRPFILSTDCPFYDTVDAVIYDGMLRWECPLCGYDHEEEPPFPGDYEPDRSDDPEWDEDY